MRTMRQRRGGAAALAAAALAALTMSGQFDTFANPLPLPATAPAAVQPAAECEGTACQQVTMTFDESKQQYHVQNNSSDRWVRVSASNLAAGASVCLGPGKTGFLPLKSIVEPYHADYSEPRCGAPEGVGD